MTSDGLPKIGKEVARRPDSLELRELWPVITRLEGPELKMAHNLVVKKLCFSWLLFQKKRANLKQNSENFAQDGP